MITVIKHGTKKAVDCTCCGSKLMYEREDVKTDQTGMNEYEKYILCPVCKEKIRVGDS